MPRPVYDKPHARIYREWLELPAWRTLNTNARALLTEVLTAFRPGEPNRFELSERRVADLLRCGRPAAAQALNDLEDRGWLEVVRVGKMRGPKAGRASAYALTTRPRLPGERPSKAFLTWRPAPIQQLDSKPSTVPIRATDGSFQGQSASSAKVSTCSTRH